MGVHTTWNGMEILDERECWAVLSHETVGRLAVTITDHPDIFPINHVVDRSRLLFRTAEGTKLAAAVLGRAVAYEVDGHDDERREAWSVVVKGRAEEIEVLEDLLRAMDLPLYPWHDGPKHRWVRIVPTEVTGRRFHMSAGARVPE